jgi:methionyl-tRNA formyltransferase
MGTPEFACPILEALVARRDPVVAVVCQPDRARGRGLAVTPPPVKLVALARGLPVLQPDKLRDPAFIAALRDVAPDLIVVAAYGKILPRTILDLPRHGCINVHASLLPRHRGAAPITHAILAGDPVTGVTIMVMNEEMDAGDVLFTLETHIGPEETAGTLTARLAALGATAIGEAIDGLRAGTLRPVPQPTAGITFAPRIERAHCVVDWSRPADALARQVRGLAPAPSAFTTLGGKLLKLHRAGVEPAGLPRPGATAPRPGEILPAGGLVAATGAGALRLLEVQLAGGKRMDAAAFVAGHRVPPGTCLGT